jgi:riboflavin synthase
MFTGLITDIGTIADIASTPGGRRLRVACGPDPGGLVVGESIACAGICLTVVAAGPVGDGRAWFEADLSAETLAVSTAGSWTPGARLNLERSLRVGDALGGHLVAGHVDGVAEILDRADDGSGAGFRLRAPQALSRFIAAKGSVTLDGVSLTVNLVEGDEFTVMIIPHTLAVTTFGGRQAGERVNLEVDLMARYAARLLASDAG